MKNLLLFVSLFLFSNASYAASNPAEDLAEALAGSYILTLENEKLTIDINKDLEGVIWMWGDRDVRQSVKIYSSNVADQGLPLNFLITLNLGKADANSNSDLVVYLSYKKLEGTENYRLYFQDSMAFEGQSVKNIPNTTLEKRVHRSGLTEVIPPG